MGKKLTYDYVKEQIELVDGYKLLSTGYENSGIKLKVQCDKGHIYHPTYNNFQHGKRCGKCFGKEKLTYDYVKEQIELVDGYKLLSTGYENSGIKLEIKCDNDHIYYVTYSNFRKGHRCGDCYRKSSISIPEIFIQEYVKILTDTEVIYNDRSQVLNSNTGWNLELDIYLPKLKKAIEFNGRYWHSSDWSKKKDKMKIDQCKEMKIDLLVIQEQDWIEDIRKELMKINIFIRGNEKLL